MKNLLTNVSKRAMTVLAAAGLLGVLSMSSCLKSNNDSIATQQPVALLSVVQAVPDAPQLDFYLDNGRVNLTPLSYNGHIDYFRVYAGKRNAVFYTTGTTTKQFADSLYLQENQIYSLFISNTTASPKFLVLTDTISKPLNNNAGIRFVNVSSDAGPVDLAIQGGAVIASNIGYNQYTSFVTIGGNQTYTFEIRQAGTNTVLTKLSSASLNANSVYTVYLHGLANTTDNTKKLAADALLNAYY